MNYRHAFHAGNFADVLKHVLLRELVQAMQRKPKPFLYVDTHGGRGRYDLVRDGNGRTEEWRDGIARLWERADLPAPVAAYVAAVREFNRHEGAGAATLRFYPGSPWFAQQLLRPEDRAAFCELQPEEFRALKHQFAEVPRTRVHDLDGYVAPRAMLPPPEKRALVLIDPPFEAQDEFADVLRAVNEGLRRLPAGVFAVWYPISERAPAAPFLGSLRHAGVTPTVTFELRVAAPSAEPGAGLAGCGVAVCNPPWQFAEAFAPVGTWLAEVLAVEPGANFRIDWVVREKP